MGIGEFVIFVIFAPLVGFLWAIFYEIFGRKRGLLSLLCAIATCIISFTVLIFTVAPRDYTDKLLNNVSSVFLSKEVAPQHKPDSNVAKKLGNSPLLKD